MIFTINSLVNTDMFAWKMIIVVLVVGLIGLCVWCIWRFFKKQRPKDGKKDKKGKADGVSIYYQEISSH